MRGPYKIWTNKQRDKAAKLRAEGKSSVEIADVLGRTKGSVVGFLWRTGVPGIRLNGGEARRDV